MLEIRYIREFKDGVLVNEIPYTVSDEELVQEQLERDANDASHNCANALDDWDNLSNSGKREIVKDALICIKLLITRR